MLGRGSFGKVLLARRYADQRLYAVKVLEKRTVVRRNETQHIMAERNVLRNNQHHPFLVSLHSSFQTKEKLYFVLDYVNGGEVFVLWHHCIIDILYILCIRDMPNLT